MFVHRFPRLFSARPFSSSAYLSALNVKALPFAEKISAEWKGTSATGGDTKNFIAGEFVQSNAIHWFDVLDPVRLHMCS